MKEQFIRLKDRLNDLSKRNRSIRLLKLYNKWNFDLASLEELKEPNHVDEQATPRGQQVNYAEHVLERIRKGNRSVQLLKRSPGNEAAAMMSHRLNTLARNLHAIEDETGLYDLYVGYPFLCGMMSDGTYFRAPLLLYPVRLTLQKTSPQQWRLEKQDDGEPLLNRPLFLALKKFHHLHLMTPSTMKYPIMLRMI